MCDVMKGEKYLPLMPVEKCPNCGSLNMYSNKEHNVYYCVNCFYTACMKCGKPVEICRAKPTTETQRHRENEGDGLGVSSKGLKCESSKVEAVRSYSVTPATELYNPLVWLLFILAMIIGIALGSCVDPVFEKKAIEQPVFNHR